MAKRKGQHHIVPMPAFVDPYNPKALGGSINYGVAGNFPPFEDHPVEHSADYGAGILSPRERASVLPDDREEWKKDDWKQQAKEYGLPVTGNIDELIERVVTYEKEQGGEQ